MFDRITFSVADPSFHFNLKFCDLWPAMKRSIVAISLLTAFWFLPSFRPSNCAPVDQETGFKSAEKDGEYGNADSGNRVQSDQRNGIAFLDLAHCFNHLIDQKSPHVACDRSLLHTDRSITGTPVKQETAEGNMTFTQKRERRQVSSGQKIKLPKALELVEQYGLKQCVARTSCELACDPNLYGRRGRSLYRFMALVYKRNRIPGIPAAAVAFYRSSIAAGAKLKGQNCKDECNSQFTGCTRQTSVLLRMASHIDLSI